MPIAALLSRQTSLSLGMSLGMSLALLSCPGAAQAVGATAHIDWSAVTVDLVDTQPDDAAAFFVPIPQSSWTTCRATGVSSCSPPPLAFPAPYPDTTGRHTAEGPGHSAQTQFLSDQFSASASGTLDTAGELDVSTSFSFGFFISGPARLTLHIPYTLHVDDADGNDRDFSVARVSFLDAEAAPTDVALSSFADGTRSVVGVWSRTVDATEPFWNAQFLLTVSAGLRNNGTVIGSPVPEPGAALMLVAGLACVGLAQRRRH